jgi:hypothetical protein
MKPVPPRMSSFLGATEPVRCGGNGSVDGDDAAPSEGDNARPALTMEAVRRNSRREADMDGTPGAGSTTGGNTKLTSRDRRTAP